MVLAAPVNAGVVGLTAPVPDGATADGLTVVGAIGATGALVVVGATVTVE